jgi:hypothetical protein
MSTGRFPDVAARARAELQALEVPEPYGWDAGGDGCVIMTREEMEALHRWCFGDNLRALIAASARGWARTAAQALSNPEPRKTCLLPPFSAESLRLIDQSVAGPANVELVEFE